MYVHIIYSHTLREVDRNTNIVILSYCHIVILSYCHIVILSYCHIVILSLSLCRKILRELQCQQSMYGKSMAFIYFVLGRYMPFWLLYSKMIKMDSVPTNKGVAFGKICSFAQITNPFHTLTGMLHSTTIDFCSH